MFLRESIAGLLSNKSDSERQIFAVSEKLRRRGLELIQETNEHCGALRARGAAIRVEVVRAVVVRIALDEAVADGPGHRGVGPVGHTAGIGEGADRRGVPGEFRRVLDRVPVQERDQLLARDGGVGREHSRARAGSDVVVVRPGDGIVVPRAGGDVGERQVVVAVVGLIAGALTSTPGLAVAIDSTNSPLASIAYGIAYPFGVIGVILFVKLLPKIMRVDLDKEARRLEIERRGQFPELTTCIYRVTNANVFDRSLVQINARGMTGAVISRLKHNDEISIPTAHTVLHEGDYIQAVGSEESLDQLAVLVGNREEGELPLDKTQEIESLLLTKKDMINKQLGDLNLQKNFGCTVTRVRRSGIDLSPSPDLALKFGDKLMVVGEKEGLKGVARLLGNNAKKLSDTDFFPIAMGIVLGVLFGKINISFSDSLSFSPGLTGGVLMVALVLSAIGKTGPIIWSMSGPANQLLRQLGLLLFLAEVGTSAGKNLVATFQESGLLMFGVGAAITLVPMLVAAIVGHFVFKISLLDLLGTITGGMTSTPGLAAADSMVDSNIPSVAYATVYPIAMVFLILFIQIIASAVY